MIKYYDMDYDRDYQDVVDLCGTWWEDSLFYKTYRIPYKVDKRVFDAGNEAGALLAFAGRNEEGKAVAAYVAIISPYLFNPEYLMAVECVWCLHKDYRNLGYSIGLLDEIEKRLIDRGVNILSLASSAAPEYASLGMLLRRRGYTLMDNIYMKSLRGGYHE